MSFITKLFDDSLNLLVTLLDHLFFGLDADIFPFLIGTSSYLLEFDLILSIQFLFQELELLLVVLFHLADLGLESFSFLDDLFIRLEF